MFPGRYFPTRMFADRYFAKVGAEGGAIVPVLWARVAAAQVFTPGAQAGVTYCPGAKAAQVFTPGAVAGKVN